MSFYYRFIVKVQVWKPGTNWHDIRQIRTNHFKESGEGSNVIRVYMIWGLGLQDRRKCHFTDYKCKGETVLDEEFDMNAPGCQISMLVSFVEFQINAPYLFCY